MEGQGVKGSERKTETMREEKTEKEHSKSVQIEVCLFQVSGENWK